MFENNISLLQSKVDEHLTRFGAFWYKNKKWQHLQPFTLSKLEQNTKTKLIFLHLTIERNFTKNSYEKIVVVE